MRLKNVDKIKANLSIAASKKTSALLEGLYYSIFKGQSLDFDDLREYTLGDNSKDIDWKSSIRHGSLLVRRYVAMRRHKILFVVDTGRNMIGITPSGETKAQVAMYMMGTLGYLVNRNGDEFGMLVYANDELQFSQFKTGLPTLERYLTQLEVAGSKENYYHLNDIFNYIVKHQKYRMIVVVIADMLGLSEMDEAVVKKMMVNHDLLFINVNDASIISMGENYDLDGRATVPKYIAQNAQLLAAEDQARREIIEQKEHMLKRYHASMTTLDSKSEICAKLIELLERHNHAVRQR